jgi:hypothetical protein
MTPALMSPLITNLIVSAELVPIQQWPPLTPPALGEPPACGQLVNSLILKLFLTIANSFISQMASR